jgi:hypothetical protein
MNHDLFLSSALRHDLDAHYVTTWMNSSKETWTSMEDSTRRGARCQDTTLDQLRRDGK